MYNICASYLFKIMAVLKSSHEEKTLLQLKIVETKKISWRDIVPFQPKGFKIGNTDGLRKSIANNELIDRFKVFTIPGSKKYFMFDGHTRHKVMLEMEEDNLYSFPDELEVDVLKFNDKKTAAITLLEYQSGKLKITESGLIEFADNVSIEHDEMLEIADNYNIPLIYEVLDEEEGSQSSASGTSSGTASSPDYVNFEIVMKLENKKALMEKLNYIKTNKNFELLEHALMELVNSYKIKK